MEEASEHDEEARVEGLGQEADEVRLDSVTLARLLDEVRHGGTVEPNAYNRMHNRHNR